MLVLLVLITGLAAWFVVDASSGEREQAERRFEDRARITADLTGALIGSAARQNARQNGVRLGEPEVSTAEVDAAILGLGAEYAVVMDHRGTPIATSSGAPRDIRQRLNAGPAALRLVRSGAPYAWTPTRTVGGMAINEGYSRLETDSGPRILLRAFPTRIITAFMAEYLRTVPRGDGEQLYVSAANPGDVIASFAAGQRAPGPLRDRDLAGALARGDGPGDLPGGRRFAASRVPNTPWRIVFDVPSASVTAGTGERTQWVLLAAVLLLGGTAAVLLSRFGRAKRSLRAAFTALERTHRDARRANTELQRSNGELEQFASVASHDLQEPLRKVQAFGDQLERRFGDEIPAEAKDYLRRMRSASARMSVLIEDLLRFSRVTTHAAPHVDVDLARVAREVHGDLQEALRSTGGTVRIGPLPTVDADPTQMRQLLQNLLGNGLKFHRPGHPPLVRISETDAPSEDLVAFTVTDDGIGLDPVYAERIFRVFERLHPRDVYAGTGIGLALCRKIAERHGGTITVDSTEGEGARFTVTLSRVRADDGHDLDDGDAGFLPHELQEHVRA